MPDVKRILFLLVIILSFYLLFKLVEKRQYLLAEFNENEIERKEPFEVMSRISQSKNMTLPLKEYVIMLQF